MNKHLKVELSEAATRLIERQLETGEFKSAEDVILSSLQRQEEERQRVESLNTALEEGIASGFVENFDFDEFLAEMNAKYAHLK